MMKLRNPFKRKKTEPIALLTPEQGAELELAISPPTQAKGRIVRTISPEYSPNINHKAGRIVKAMPRQLRKATEIIEKSND